MILKKQYFVSFWLLVSAIKLPLLIFTLLVLLFSNNGDRDSMNQITLRNVIIKWLGHASFQITGAHKTIYIDPFVLPENPHKADYILISHEHFDHCEPNNIEKLTKEETHIIGVESAMSKLMGDTHIISPGESFPNTDNIDIRAVEAYNTNKFRSPGEPFHPKGLGIGFVLTVDGVKIYHTGDTDNIPEMQDLHGEGIDVALLPSGGKYTMDMHEAAQAAQVIKPKFAIPMHYNSDKYGVPGINATPIDLAKALVGKGIMVNILDPAV